MAAWSRKTLKNSFLRFFGKTTPYWKISKILFRKDSSPQQSATGNQYKNASGDEIANVNFYAVRPEATRIRWNNAK